MQRLPVAANAVDNLFVSRTAGAVQQSSSSLEQLPQMNSEEEDDIDECLSDLDYRAAMADRQRMCRCFSRCPRAPCLGKSMVVSCNPRYQAMVRQLLTAGMAVAMLAGISASIATSCGKNAPIARLCIRQGTVQWIIAIVPSSLILLCALFWLYRTYALRQQLREHKWRHDGEAQKSAVEVLEALTAAPPEERLQYTRQAVQILKDFPSKAIIQCKGCMAIEAISRAQRGNVVQVQAAGAIPVILTALETHLRVRAVQRAGLSAISCLAKVGKQQIFDDGGIPILLSSMAKFRRDKHVQVSGAMALGALCISSATNRRSVVKYGGMKLLMEAFQRHLDHADVLIAASETLVLLCQDNGKNRKEMTGSLAIIQELIGRYEDARLDDINGKRSRDCDIVLRSLRKLAAQLCDTTGGDDSDGSEAAAPQVNPGKEAFSIAIGNSGQALDLQDRIAKWKSKKKAKFKETDDAIALEEGIRAFQRQEAEEQAKQKSQQKKKTRQKSQDTRSHIKKKRVERRSDRGP